MDPNQDDGQGELSTAGQSAAENTRTGTIILGYN